MVLDQQLSSYRLSSRVIELCDTDQIHDADARLPLWNATTKLSCQIYSRYPISPTNALYH